MSNRANVLFAFSDSNKPDASVYLHYDGKPSDMIPFLKDFFESVKRDAPTDTRFNDPHYLAARFIVHTASKHAPSDKPLNFLGIGVNNDELPDAFFTYLLECTNSSEVPVIKWLRNNIVHPDHHCPIAKNPAWLPSDAVTHPDFR